MDKDRRTPFIESLQDGQDDMKIIIAGSRKIDSFKAAMFAMVHLPIIIVDNKTAFTFDGTHPITEFVTGDCPTGPDQVPYGICKFVQMKPKITSFPADWEKHGKAAGPIRNRQMADYADGLLLLWDGKSPGSHNMRCSMHKLNKSITEVILNERKDN